MDKLACGTCTYWDGDDGFYIDSTFYSSPVCRLHYKGYSKQADSIGCGDYIDKETLKTYLECMKMKRGEQQ